ncbi:tetratricopeptide repeat protein [uncultured Paraglaciecola sp.]|mgnify:CR=1 FL=1|uniref:tetratricopeptide repeat protein n=1 Tax=uncultured Paraglaciecola sp. TaxID=1765024 RepID=UPI0030D71FF6|tara:strand:- start:103553 stop:105601 length:2049 start_codon:yes stop_codon:yes gene_type:complete
MLKCINALTCCFVLLVNTQVNAQQVSEPNSVQLQKAYQQVLYEYYQGNFALALTQMAILEQKFPNGLTQIPDFLSANSVEPELLKGGMSLAYGLDNQASEIFLRLLKNNTAPEVTAYAWLLLGKTYYQKRQFEDAANAFQKISADDAAEYFDLPIRDNWLYMQSQLHGFLLTQAPSGTDIQWLEQLSENSIYRHYVQYNQALALLQQGENQQAISRLSTLAKNDKGFVRRWMGWADPIFNDNDEQSITDERDAIRDRANLTLGYTLLQNDAPHEAFRVFENIRTYGLDAEAAILGYGWAAAKKDELQTALAVWQRLILMPLNNEYTLEAYLASAYAYEKAFAPRQSLQVLQLGMARFEQALTDLTQAEQQVNQRQFILDLLPNTKTYLDPGEGVNLASEDNQQSFNNSGLFSSVTVSSEFRAGLSALQQNRDIQQQLQNWQQRMQHYHLMLDERQAERINRAKHILQNRTLEQLAELQTQREGLAKVVATAQQQRDGQVFMPLQSQQWVSRVARAEKSLESISRLKQQLGQAPLAESYQQRLKRVSGRLIWQASEAYAANQWQAQKALNQLDNAIIETQQRQQQLLAQLAVQPDFAEQRLRVSNLAQRINTEIAKSKDLQDALISQLSDIFNASIQEQKQKVTHYILQGQLAMVRLSDQALQKDNNSTEKPDDEPQIEGGQL